LNSIQPFPCKGKGLFVVVTKYNSSSLHITVIKILALFNNEQITKQIKSFIVNKSFSLKEKDYRMSSSFGKAIPLGEKNIKTG